MKSHNSHNSLITNMRLHIPKPWCVEYEPTRNLLDMMNDRLNFRSCCHMFRSRTMKQKNIQWYSCISYVSYMSSYIIMIHTAFIYQSKVFLAAIRLPRETRDPSSSKLQMPWLLFWRTYDRSHARIITTPIQKDVHFYIHIIYAHTYIYMSIV